MLQSMGWQRVGHNSVTEQQQQLVLKLRSMSPLIFCHFKDCFGFVCLLNFQMLFRIDINLCKEISGDFYRDCVKSLGQFRE